MIPISNKVYDENFRKIRQFCKNHKGKQYSQPYYMDNPKNPEKSNFTISCNVNPKDKGQFSLNINNPNHGALQINGIRGDKKTSSQLDFYIDALPPENVQLFFDDIGLITNDKKLMEEKKKKQKLNK